MTSSLSAAFQPPPPTNTHSTRVTGLIVKIGIQSFTQITNKPDSRTLPKEEDTKLANVDAPLTHTPHPHHGTPCNDCKPAVWPGIPKITTKTDSYYPLLTFEIQRLYL